MDIKFTKYDEKEYLNEETRRFILDAYFNAKKELSELDEDDFNDLDDFEEKEEQLIDSSINTIKSYNESLPFFHISRCPFCGTVLEHLFDPWGIDGPWWQDDELHTKGAKYIGCEHFRLLKGSVNLNNNPPKGSDYYYSFIGPNKPFIIPRILRINTMIAVISSFKMANGYTAYPIAYFSEKEAPIGSLTAPWARTEYYYKMADGSIAWTNEVEYPEFDIQKWIDIDRIQWIEEDDFDLNVKNKKDGKCIYTEIREEGVMQSILKEGCYTSKPVFVDPDDALPSDDKTTKKKSDKEYEDDDDFTTIV